MRLIESKLLFRCAYNMASEKEERELNEWLRKSRKHRTYYHHLKQRVDNHDVNVLNERDIEVAWRSFNRKLLVRHTLPKYTAYAAIFISPLMLALVMIFNHKNEEKIKVSENLQIELKSEAIFLSGDQIFTLGEKEPRKLKDNSGDVLANDSSNLLRVSEDLNVIQNVVKTNIGAKYKIMLSDGTMVWLNAKSSLTFPGSFADNIREVQLTGEAIFDVTNNTQPFIVHTSKSKVHVYGTLFNVSSYEDEVEKITLAEGSIDVIIGSHHYPVKPGEQLINNQTKIKIDEVNSDYYMSWIDGIFYFDNMRLQDLSKRLQKWYDFDFFFQNESLKNKKFTGTIKKNTNLRHFFEMIEKSSDVQIIINENNVLLKEKSKP